MKNVSYIGIDVHVETCTVVVVSESGRIKSQERIVTGEKTLMASVRKIKGCKKLVIEETSLSQWVFTFLKDEVEEMIVCSPSHLPKKRGPKNDNADAFELADLLRCKRLTSVYHDTSDAMKLRCFVSGYVDLGQTIVRIKNKMNALARRQGIQIKRNDDYLSGKVLQELDHDHKRFVFRELQDQLELNLKQKNMYMEKFKDFKREHSLIKLLTSIPGIGLIFSNQLYATTVNGERFPNKYKFFGYCRLVKYQDESDGKYYGKRPSFGRKDLKGVFKTAGITSLRGTSGIREYYDYQRERGKSHGTALNATCRKIASIVLSVMKNKQSYSDKKLRGEIEFHRKTLKHSS